MSYSLYILRSEQKETYYIGLSDDPVRRMGYHNHESKDYTQKYRPWELVYTQEFASKEAAAEAERAVKSWKSKKMTRLLVAGEITIADYL